MTDQVLDDQYDQAVRFVIASQKPNNSAVQRQFGIGYNEAAEMIERMEADGIVSTQRQDGTRKLLLNEAPKQRPTVDSVAQAHGITDPVVTGAVKMIVGEDLNVKEKAVAAATEAALGHNSQKNGPDLLNMDDSLTETARDKLRMIVERIERLEEEKKEVAEQIKEVKSESKALGYDVRAINEVIKLRKQDRQERQEREAILEIYLDALGEL